MTKPRCYVFLLFFISSCGVLKVPEYLSLFDNLIFGADFIIDRDYYESQEFSFAKVSMGRDQVAIVTLGFIKPDILEWYSSTQAGIFTQNGKIISLIEFPHDFNAEVKKNLAFNRNYAQSNSVNLYLKDPDGFFIQNSVLKFERDEQIQYLGDMTTVEFYTETVQTHGLKWNFTNKYWVDRKSVV